MGAYGDGVAYGALPVLALGLNPHAKRAPQAGVRWQGRFFHLANHRPLWLSAFGTERAGKKLAGLCTSGGSFDPWTQFNARFP